MTGAADGLRYRGVSLADLTTDLGVHVPASRRNRRRREEAGFMTLQLTFGEKHAETVTRFLPIRR